MRISEMSGTIQIGNSRVPATAHSEYADETAEVRAEQLKSFNEQCTKLARVLAHRPRHYRVPYHARKVSQKRVS